MRRDVAIVRSIGYAHCFSEKNLHMLMRQVFQGAMNLEPHRRFHLPATVFHVEHCGPK